MTTASSLTNASTYPHASLSEDAIVQVLDLSAGYAHKAVVHNVDCSLFRGELVGIIGPNGCGKSTLLKTISGCLTPLAGAVLIDGQPLANIPRRQRARRLAVLPQAPTAPEGMTVRDLVHCGRVPHLHWLELFGPDHQAAVDHALRLCGLMDLAESPLTQLSGGQRQRAWIAMAIAQQTPIMLLDEPTSALDIRHQLDVIHLLRHLVRRHRLAVMVAIHDINLAIRYCDRVMIMDRGRIVGERSCDANSDWRLLEQVFDVVVHHSTTADGRHTLAFHRPMEGQP